MIGATPFFALSESALKIYGHHHYADEKQASGNTWEAFTAGYREQRMEEIDKRFYNQPTSIADVLSAYIRANLELYVEKSG